MTESILTIVYIAGVIQGGIILIALFNPSLLNVTANKVLIGLLFAIIVVLIFFLFHINNLHLIPYSLYPLATACWFAIGPLFYLYTKACQTKRSFKLEKKHTLLFTFFMYNILQIVLIILGIKFDFSLLFSNHIIYGYIWVLTYVVHSLVFIAASVYITLNSKEEELNKLKFFLLALLITLFAFLVMILIQSNGDVYYGLSERALAAIFSAFIIYLGIKSIRDSSHFSASIGGKKYFNSLIDKQNSEALLERLNQAIKVHQPYLNKDLTLASLATISEIKENDLSQLFSQHMRSGFYDFIRDLRLKEVEKRLCDPKFKNLKIVAIAEESGFKSRALFYRAFKAKHGITPAEYVKKVAN